MSESLLTLSFNEELDLRFERDVDVPPEKVWAAWTTPEQLVHWFTPAPWKTTLAEIDLRPGGKFRTVMKGPAGEKHDNAGCYLHVVPGRQLIWTDALGPDFRPSGNPFTTACVTFQPTATGTKYIAHAMHPSPEVKQQHDQMGFESGWGTALDQLVAFVKSGA